MRLQSTSARAMNSPGLASTITRILLRSATGREKWSGDPWSHGLVLWLKVCLVGFRTSPVQFRFKCVNCHYHFSVFFWIGFLSLPFPALLISALPQSLAFYAGAGSSLGLREFWTPFVQGWPGTFCCSSSEEVDNETEHWILHIHGVFQLKYQDKDVERDVLAMFEFDGWNTIWDKKGRLQILNTQIPENLVSGPQKSGHTLICAGRASGGLHHGRGRQVWGPAATVDSSFGMNGGNILEIQKLQFRTPHDRTLLTRWFIN